VVTWAESAAHAASDGSVSEENLWALIGHSVDPVHAWSIARDAYLAVLDDLGRLRDDLALKLIVPLRPTESLVMEPPRASDITDEIDAGVPPSFVVHELVPRRDWERVEEYRRPLSGEGFFDVDTEGLEGLYIVFRTGWEIDNDAPYRRQLLFEYVSTRAE
jgi:hypothetical protein